MHILALPALRWLIRWWDKMYLWIVKICLLRWLNSALCYTNCLVTFWEDAEKQHREQKSWRPVRIHICDSGLSLSISLISLSGKNEACSLIPIDSTRHSRSYSFVLMVFCWNCFRCWFTCMFVLEAALCAAVHELHCIVQSVVSGILSNPFI